ncbi:hypothetical protein RRG08_036499 [Elysia crispata]|uniref:Uncharacterized protein n=1 Tax=Elysia crispata TaxID=231223 RepID=A0AAE0ZKA3_9GAST|nr:hypothetical protein RRG08_036499 [Elysia crispata]
MLCLTRNSFIPKDKSRVIIQDSTLSIQQGRSSSTPDFVQNSGAFNNCKQNYKSPTIDRLIQWPGQGTYCKFCGALSFHFRPFHVCFDTIFQQYVTAYGNCPCLTRPTMQHFMKVTKWLQPNGAIQYPDCIRLKPSSSISSHKVSLKTSFCNIALKTSFCNIALKTPFCNIALKTSFCNIALKTSFCSAYN